MDASLNKRISCHYVGSAESLKTFVQQFVVLLRFSFNSSLFCRDVRSTVRYSAETFVRRVHVRLTCVDAFFDACLEVLSRRLRRSTQGPSSMPSSRSLLVVCGALLILFSVEWDARHLEH